MHRYLFLLIFFSSILFANSYDMPGFFPIKRVIAISRQEFLSANAEYLFGQTLTLKLQMKSQQPILSGIVSVKEVAGNNTGLASVSVSQLDEDNFLLSAAIDLVNFPLRPYSDIQYRFDANLQDGNTIQSPEFFFAYVDNRFEWQTIEENGLRIHWNGNNPSLGGNILQIAEKGLNRAVNLLNFADSAPIDIYVYNQVDDFKRILPRNIPDWSMGHAEPDLSLVMVALPDGPEQDFLMQQYIPHEIMHILVARLVGNHADSLPTWLREGLASLAEISPNPDYAVVLTNAQVQNRLIPMNSLCDSFPQDPSNSILAYAQSASFTRFLFTRYGSKGLISILETYSTSEGCSEDLDLDFGKTLRQLENLWQQDTMGSSDIAIAVDDITPWLALLLSIFIAPLLVVFVSLKKKASRFR